MSTQTRYALMIACPWDTLTINGVAMPTPATGPQRFIPVFDTQEQAVEWGSDGDTIIPITTAPNEAP